MTTPVISFGDYIVTFTAEPEDRSAYDHFKNECGWTASEARNAAKLPFFCAHVEIFKNGNSLASDYLGCCSYRTEREFYTTFIGDYFSDMVRNCADEINDPGLTAMVSTWVGKVRAS